MQIRLAPRCALIFVFAIAALAGLSPAVTASGGGYAASNTGIANSQVSTQPVTKACPTSADWLRDPEVCAHRWATVGNDKSESDLAVDPTNANHLVGLSKIFWSPHDYLFDLEWFNSNDDGQHWTMGLLPGYDKWADATDPTLAFDSQGNLYTLVLGFNFVIESNGSHNWSVGQTEPVHLNDAIYLSRSLTVDGDVGRIWKDPVQIATYSSSGLGRTADKQWVAADPYGNHPGSVYMSWIQLDGASFSGQDMFSRWDEQTRTFTTPRVVTSNASSPHFNGDPYVLTGPEGNLYYSYDNLPPKQQYATSSFQVMLSHDNGDTFLGPGQQIQSTIANQSGQSLPDTYRDGTPYTITADPVNGHLFMAYEQFGGGTPRRSQWLAESSDAGTTWIKLGQIDDPSASGETTQAKIFAAPGPSGIFGVAFYDRRLACPSNTPHAGAIDTCIDVTIQFYNPDGTPRGGNQRVTQESWDPNVNPALPGGFGASTTFIGDYFGGAMTADGVAHLLFVSTSPKLQAGALAGGGLVPPYQQQVYATVPAP